jgi:hypothetical protein
VANPRGDVSSATFPSECSPPQRMSEGLQAPLPTTGGWGRRGHHVAGLGESLSGMSPSTTDGQFAKPRTYSMEADTAQYMRGNRGRSVDAIDPDQRLQLAMMRRQGWSIRGIWGWMNHIVEALLTSAAQLHYELQELKTVRDIMLNGQPEAVLQLLQNSEADLKRLRGTNFSVPEQSNVQEHHTAVGLPNDTDEDIAQTTWCQRVRGTQNTKQLFENQQLATCMELRLQSVKNSPAKFIFDPEWKNRETARWQNAVPKQWCGEEQPEVATPRFLLEPEPELGESGLLSRQVSTGPAAKVAQDPGTLVNSLVNRYGRASPDKSMVLMGMEISRLKHLIDTKNDMNMKMVVGATTLLFLFAQHEYLLHTESQSGDEAQ